MIVQHVPASHFAHGSGAVGAPILAAVDAPSPDPETDPFVPMSKAQRAAKTGRRDPGAWAVLGALLGAVIVAAWAMLVYTPPPSGVGVYTQSGSAIIRCSPATISLIDTIEARLTVPGGGGLRDGYTVVSPDHVGTYFVAARINGIGMAGTVGLWATNDLSGGEGAIYSVNHDARSFSDWPDGGQTGAQLTELDVGADVVLACADG